MRHSDMHTSVLAEAYWLGLRPEGQSLCPLLADLDRFLQYLEEIHLQPGLAINPCPECGEEHRWVLVKRMLTAALNFVPADATRLTAWNDRRLEPIRALYGGRQGLEALRQGAAEYFQRIASYDPEKARAAQLERQRRRNEPPSNPPYPPDIC